MEGKLFSHSAPTRKLNCEGWRSRQLVERLNLHSEGLADGWMGDVTMRGVESGPQVRVILKCPSPSFPEPQESRGSFLGRDGGRASPGRSSHTLVPRANPTAILGQFNPRGGVIAGLFPTSNLAVDVCIDQASGDRRAQ